MSTPTSPSEDELRDELTAIMYGADWKEIDIADAFKPDVEAAMSLIEKYVTQKVIDELERLSHDDAETHESSIYGVTNRQIHTRIKKLSASKTKGESNE